MRLETPAGEFMLHFWYPESFDTRDTIVNVHFGPCEKPVRPCVNAGQGHGWAACSSLDQFVKVTGRKIALARALKSAGFSYETRTHIWHAYFNHLGQEYRT